MSILLYVMVLISGVCFGAWQHSWYAGVFCITALICFVGKETL